MNLNCYGSTGFSRDSSWSRVLPHRRMAKIGYVGHDREFVRFLNCKVLWLHHLRDAKILLSEVHGICDIV